MVSATPARNDARPPRPPAGPSARRARRTGRRAAVDQPVGGPDGDPPDRLQQHHHGDEGAEREPPRPATAFGDPAHRGHRHEVRGRRDHDDRREHDGATDDAVDVVEPVAQHREPGGEREGQVGHLQGQDEDRRCWPAGQVEGQCQHRHRGETDRGHGDPAHLLALLAARAAQPDDDRGGAGHEPGEDAGVRDADEPVDRCGRGHPTCVGDPRRGGQGEQRPDQDGVGADGEQQRRPPPRRRQPPARRQQEQDGEQHQREHAAEQVAEPLGRAPACGVAAVGERKVACGAAGQADRHAELPEAEQPPDPVPWMPGEDDRADEGPHHGGEGNAWEALAHRRGRPQRDAGRREQERLGHCEGRGDHDGGPGVPGGAHLNAPAAGGGAERGAGSRSPARRPWNGTMPDTVVPAPVADVTAREPARASTRSRMFCSPVPVPVTGVAKP